MVREMEDYCIQDVHVTTKLWKHFPLPEWVSLEHQVQTILTQQEIHGWRFDEQAAWELTSTLREELQEIEESLRRQHPYVQGAEFTPKRDNSPQDMLRVHPLLD
jgi:hypothetical protein